MYTFFILWHQVFKVRSYSCDPEVKQAQATNCRNSKKKPQNFRWCNLKHCFTWSLHSSTSPIILIDFLTFFVEKIAAVRSAFHFGTWLSWSPSDVTLPAPLDVTPLYFKRWTVSPTFIWMIQMAQKHSFEWSKWPKVCVWPNTQGCWVKHTLYWSLILTWRLFIAAAPKCWNLSPCGLLTVLLT